MHHATNSLIRSSVVGALCVAAMALVGVSPARASVGSDQVARPARCGWQRTDSTGTAAHHRDDADPAASGSVLQQAPSGKVDPSVAVRRSARHGGLTCWGTLADQTAPVADACSTWWSEQHTPSSQHCAPRIGRAPPTA